MTPLPPIAPIGSETLAPARDTFATSGAEWQVGPAVAPAQPAGGSSFGQLLADQVGQLGALQTDAAQQAQAVATGTASDVSSAVMAVERAQLAMQLASQVRTKLTEAAQDVLHTQV